MRNYFLYAMLLVPALFMSCEKEVDFKFNKKEKLVVFSQFTANNFLDVLVYKASPFNTHSSTEFVTDATVLVFSNGEFLEALELVPANDANGMPPFYRSKVLQPKTGEVYLIKVTVPGFEPITAENSIPVPVPIQSVQLTSNFTDDPSDDGISILNFDISVTVVDPKDVRNFYHLIFHQQLISYTVTPSGDTLLGAVTYAQPRTLSPKDPNFPFIKHFDNKGFLIEDKTFNGQKVVFGATGSYVYDPRQFLPGDFLVELRTVSEAYFYHFSTLILQDELGNNPLSEGVVIYDNIVNGIGIFAGYSSSVNTFQLRN